MLIEFAGCSASGKTTLPKKVLTVLRSRGFPAVYLPTAIAQATHSASMPERQTAYSITRRKQILLTAQKEGTT